MQHILICLLKRHYHCCIFGQNSVKIITEYFLELSLVHKMLLDRQHEDIQ